MTEHKFKWHFPSTDNGDEDGINDPLRETFEGDHERYVARETIQNSLDARKDNKKPVLVRFERFNLPVNQIPGLEDLKSMLQHAKDYSRDQEKSAAFYGNALALLEQPVISVLKASDFNTVGLNGEDDDTSGGLYKLTRGVGVNSMSGVGGGSFGIGKGAPFAASGLRTVFYSTVNKKKEHVFKGKARLSSFKNDSGDIRRGIGDYGVETERGVSSVRLDQEIPAPFRRKEQGTDFFIMGYQTLEQDWTRLLLNSLLNNFWAAIHFNELDVELAENGKVILKVNEDNLKELMAEHASEKGGSYNFYQAVVEPTRRIEGTLPNLGEVTLFVKTGEGYPKDVQMMRKSKMVVYTIGNYRVLPEPYAAVFICDSDKGNKILRGLEPPAHDKWDPNRDKEFGRVAHRELIDWIRQSLQSMAEDKDAKPEDIPELSKWLPEEEKEDDNPFLGTTGQVTDKQTETETSREIGAQQNVESTDTVRIKQREVAITKMGVDGSKDSDGKHNGGKSKNPHKIESDPGDNGNIQYIDVSNIRFRAREINQDGQRVYQAVIRTKKDDSGAIRLVAIGDDANYPVELERVADSNGNSIEFNGALIKNLELKANDQLKLFVSLKGNKRYALGIE